MPAQITRPQLAKCGADELAVSRILWLCMLTINRVVRQDTTSTVLAEREAIAKWLQVRLPITQTKQQVRPYTQGVTDEPFLNRVSQVRILPGAPRQSHKQR